MDFGVRPRDKTPKSGVAHCKLSTSQESENEQNQIDAQLFFFLTVRGSSTRNLCHQHKLSIKLFIGKSLNVSGKGGTRATRHCTHLDAAPRQSPTSHGSLHQEFLAEKSILVVPRPPYSPDLSPVTSFYSPGSKTT